MLKCIAKILMCSMNDLSSPVISSRAAQGLDHVLCLHFFDNQKDMSPHRSDGFFLEPGPKHQRKVAGPQSVYSFTWLCRRATLAASSDLRPPSLRAPVASCFP